MATTSTCAARMSSPTEMGLRFPAVQAELYGAPAYFVRLRLRVASWTRASAGMVTAPKLGQVATSPAIILVWFFGRLVRVAVAPPVETHIGT
jgi:hypothetical protein